MNLLSKNLLKELGLGNLPEEDQTELMLSIGRIIQQNIIIRVLDELSDEDREEFDRLLGDNKDDGATLNFLKEKIKNLDGILEEEIKKFKQSSVELLNKINQSQQ